MWKYNHTPDNNELYHYGIPGMKWGKRKINNVIAKKASKKLNKKIKKTFKSLDSYNKSKKIKYVKNEYGDSPYQFVISDVKKKNKWIKNAKKADRYMDKLRKKYGSNWRYASNYSRDNRRVGSGKGFVETTVNGHKVRKEWK